MRLCAKVASDNPPFRTIFSITYKPLQPKNNSDATGVGIGEVYRGRDTRLDREIATARELSLDWN